MRKIIFPLLLFCGTALTQAEELPMITDPSIGSCSDIVSWGVVSLGVPANADLVVYEDCSAITQFQNTPDAQTIYTCDAQPGESIQDCYGRVGWSFEPAGTYRASPPPLMQCENGPDNDGDNLIDLADPGCSSPADDDESDDPPPSPGGQITWSWINPTLNSDGTPLEDFGGVIVRWGQMQGGPYDFSATIPKPGTSYVSTGLADGMWYGVAVAFDTPAGNESAPSNEAAKNIVGGVDVSRAAPSAKEAQEAQLFTGAASCGEMVIQAEDELTAAFFQVWIAGFLAGMNIEHADEFDLLVDPSDRDAHWLWLLNYCAENPLDTVALAVTHVFVELRTKEGID